MNKENRTVLPRREFLKNSALTGIMLGVLSAAGGCTSVLSGREKESRKAAELHTGRTLGTGKNALHVSALGFGCMGLCYNRSRHPDEKAEIRLIHEAVERGVKLFDTAEAYGPYRNELLVGRALKGYSDQVFVTTKFGHKYVNGKRVMSEEDSSPANIRKVCEESLRRLGVETIGIFYQHRVDPKTPIEEVASTVGDLIREGKVLHFGLCEINAETLRRAHAVQPVTAVQSEYHLMHRNVENSILPVCEELGIGFVPYSPLNRGFLGGDITEYTRFDTTNDNRHTLPRFTPEAIRENLRIVEILHDFGRERGLTAAQIALAWLLNRKPWIVPIPGTTKLSHLEENLRAADVRFSAGEMKELEDSVAKIRVVGSRYNAVQEAKVQK